MSRSVAVLVSSLALVFALALAIGACHLADVADPKKCEPGTHADNNRCLPDIDIGQAITISVSSGVCTLSPAEVRVKVNGEFSFTNEDAVEHLITGPDGALWAKAPAGGKSPLIGITKPGAFTYQVTGCNATGTIIVE